MLDKSILHHLRRGVLDKIRVPLQFEVHAAFRTATGYCDRVVRPGDDPLAHMLPFDIVEILLRRGHILCVDLHQAVGLVLEDQLSGVRQIQGEMVASVQFGVVGQKDVVGVRISAKTEDRTWLLRFCVCGDGNDLARVCSRQVE